MTGTLYQDELLLQLTQRCSDGSLSDFAAASFPTSSSSDLDTLNTRGFDTRKNISYGAHIQLEQTMREHQTCNIEQCAERVVPSQ